MDILVYEEEKQSILNRLCDIRGEIVSIRIYLKNVEAVKRFSAETWTSRQHVIVAIESDGHLGFAESIASINNPELDLYPWLDKCSELKGLDVGAAIMHVRQKQDTWPEQLIEMLEMALIDLAGKIEGLPALEP